MAGGGGGRAGRVEGLARPGREGVHAHAHHHDIVCLHGPADLLHDAALVAGDPLADGGVDASLFEDRTWHMGLL